MEIKASGKNDLSSVKALTQIIYFGKKSPEKKLMIYAVITLSLISLSLVSWWFTYDHTIFLYSLLWGAIFACITAFYLLVIPRLQYGNLHKMKDCVNHYVFNGDSLKVETKYEGYNGGEVIQYNMLWSVKETGRYFFIYSTKATVYIVDKSTVTNGTPEDIRRTLEPILGKKYVACEY